MDLHTNNFNFKTANNIYCFLVVYYLSTHCLAVSASSVIVDSPFGKIRGAVITQKDTTESSVVFRSIPYAKPPVGQLRFAKPEPHPKLDGVFDATNDRHVLCLHPTVFLYGYEQGSEDCLILNIFAKNTKPSDGLKKVIVYIHGGGFVFGSSSRFNMASFVIAHDVIGVTINYRLGILGFLSTGNKASPGNYGLWDQALGLKWLKDNIKAFGGDPDDITISGESAGGSSVGYQTLSPVNKGMFSKVFPQSGTATSLTARAIDVQKHALEVAKGVGCWEGETSAKLDLTESEKLIQCLRDVDVSVFANFPILSLSEARFVPSVDGDFVPKSPNLMLQDKSYLESIGFFDRSYLVTMLNNEFVVSDQFFKVVKGMILNSKATEEEKAIAISITRHKIEQGYMQTRLDTDSLDSSLADDIMDFYRRRNVGDDVVLDIVTDLNFLLPAYDFLNAAAMENKCKSWFLYFNYFPAFMKGNIRGSPHGLDLMYWLDYRVADLEKVMHAGMEGDMDDGDLRLKTMFSTLIADFMKSGDPGTTLGENIPDGWPEYNPSCSHYLNFNLDPSVRVQLDREKRDLWLKTAPERVTEAHKHTEL